MAVSVRTIDIPQALLQEIAGGNVALFLGAGANKAAPHSPEFGDMPLGSQLRDLACDKFLRGECKDRSLPVLVTTSTFGSDAYNFIANKPLTLINGGQLLQLLERHGYKFRIDLAEAKKAAKEKWSPKREPAGE